MNKLCIILLFLVQVYVNTTIIFFRLSCPKDCTEVKINDAVPKEPNNTRNITLDGYNFPYYCLEVNDTDHISFLINSNDQSSLPKGYMIYNDSLIQIENTDFWKQFSTGYSNNKLINFTLNSIKTKNISLNDKNEKITLTTTVNTNISFNFYIILYVLAF